MTDQEILNEIQYHLLETPDNGASWSSGLWSVAEVSQYINDRQRRFLAETGLLLTRGTIFTLPNTERHPLPLDWMVTQRVAWHTASGTYTPLPNADSLQADVRFDASYESEIRPKMYFDTEQPSLQIQISPTSYDNGLLEIIYVAAPVEVSNNGTSFTLPDEFIPFIKWGVMADMLSKVGRGMDPERAQYCEERFQEGLEIAALLLNGFE